MKSHKSNDVKVGKLLELKKIIGQILNDVNEHEFPKVITFNRGIEHPKYRITIEEIDEDFFVDAKGSKWMKVKDDEAKN